LSQLNQIKNDKFIKLTDSVILDTEKILGNFTCVYEMFKHTN